MNTTYEVIRVANGFMVRPPHDLRNDRSYAALEIHVFPTWAEASKWLGDKFREETP